MVDPSLTIDYLRPVAHGVVCISRTFAAGGEQAGELVADRLGYRYVDGEILARAAETGDLDPATVADAEQRRSLARRLLEAMGEGIAMAPEAYAYLPPHETAAGPRQDVVRQLIREAIEQVAAEGEVVIVAHAASHALAGRQNVLRVMVTGSTAGRAARVARESDAGPDAARRQVAESDRARADYLSRFYDVSDEHATHYDVVVNTDKLTPAQTATIVVSAATV